MSETITTGFLPGAYTGPGWEETRAHLALPGIEDAPLDGYRAGMGIRDMLNRYAHTLDHGNVDDIVEFFTEDCVINFPGRTAVGKSAIREHYERLLRDTPRRFHLLTNMVVRMAAAFQSGRVSTYYFAVLQSDDRPPRAVGGMLHDQVVWADGKWKIRSRMASLDITCGIDVVVGAR